MVDDRAVAERLVDPVGVGLAWSVNRQTRAPASRSSRGDLGDRRAGVPLPAVRRRRVDRPDPGHAERRRVGAGQVHPLARPRPARTSSRPARSGAAGPRGRSPRGRWRRGARPACSSASSMNRSNQARASSRSSAVATRSRPGTPAGAVELAELEEPGVLGDLDPVTLEPGQLVRADLRGRQRTVERRRPTRRGRAARGPAASAASSGIGSTNSGYGAYGAVRIASPATHPSGVADDGPPLRPVGRRRLAGCRRSRYRLVTVATTVVTTGSAARGPRPRPGRPAGRSVMSTRRPGSSLMRQRRYRCDVEPLHPNILGRMTETHEPGTGPRRAPSGVPSSYRTSLRWRGSRRSGRERWKADETYALRPHPAARRTSTRSTPRRRRCQRQPARRARLLLHPHRPDRPLPADARQGGLLPDGLGRQRPADRAPGAELLRRALRPVAALRPRLHPAGEAGPEAPGADQPAQLRRAVRAARRWRTRRSSSRCGARSACRSTGSSTTRPSGRSRSRSASARSCATSPAARPTSPEAPTLWDVTFQTAVAQAELEARDYAGHYHRVAFHRPDGTPVYIETTRPELIPAWSR